MKKLFQIILAVAIVGLVYVIYVQISTPIRFDKETKAKKAQVIERKIVDEDDSAAMAMLKKSGKKNIEKFKIAVIDTIFAPKKVTRQDVENFRFIPGTGNKAQFIMEAGIITTESKVVIPVVECRAPYKAFLDTVAYRQEVINLIDEEQNNFNRYPGVKFGSMDSGNNEAGNWE